MFSLRKTAFSLVLVSWTFIGNAPVVADELFEHAAVAADHPLASEAGVEILRRGGNVVDAAVATGFALAVVRPSSSGLGGGGFMVIWNAATQEAVAIDYREKAPAAATRTMFVDPDDPKKVRTDLSEKGPLAIAVPGHVAGLCHALKAYGTLDLRTVLAPAIRLAREGVPIDAEDQKVQEVILERFTAQRELRERYAVLYQRYLNVGQPWKAGDKFFSPLVKVLEIIAEQGADGFYRGKVGDALVLEVRKGGGLLTAEDLQSMRPTVRKPLAGQFGSYDIYTMPPPSSGGVALLESLHILSAYAAAHPEAKLATVKPDSPFYLHVLTESFKHAFADRAEFLGDADFVKVPIDRLLSRKYAEKLAERIDGSKTKPPEAYGRFLPVNDSGTTHFSIVDFEGNAVACTETINTLFGSFLVEPKYGIILNNEMEDFTALHGVPNVFGLMQSAANAIEPGKRPLSSMTPTLLVRDGKAVHAVGGSGGPRIISATLQVLLNVTRFEMTPVEAVNAPRIHHQWLPDKLLIDRAWDERVGAALKEFQHDVQPSTNLGVVQAVTRTEKGIRGASDPRKHGRAAGY